MRSDKIVYSIIQDTLLQKAAENYCPKPYVLRDCILETNRMHDSIVNICNMKEICNSPAIKEEVLEKKQAAIFKVKSLPKQCYRGNSSMSMHSLSSMKSCINEEQLAQFQSMMKNRPSLSMRKGKNSVQGSRKNSSRLWKNKMAAFHKVQITEGDEKTEDLERMLRESKQNKPQFIQTSKNIGIPKSFQKKPKQNQTKKFAHLTTDYDGNWIQICKSDQWKGVPHFIEMEVDVLEEKPKNLCHSNSYAKLGNENLGGVGFSQLKYSDNKQNFGNLVQHKFVYKENVYEIKADELAVPTEAENLSHLQQFTLEGMNYRPNKVSFSIFQKIKKNNWKLLGENQKNKSAIPQIKKKSALKKKDSVIRNGSCYSIRSQSSNHNIKSSVVKENLSNVKVGNASALSFLLAEDNRRVMTKKNVTINSHFL